MWGCINNLKILISLLTAKGEKREHISQSKQTASVLENFNKIIMHDKKNKTLLQLPNTIVNITSDVNLYIVFV